MRLFTELKRRNVFRVAAAYAVVVWLMLQAADILLGNFGAPDWVFKSFTVLLVLGFPLALFLAWAYELTPAGIKKTRDVPLPDSLARYAGRKFDFIVIGLLAVAVAFLVFDKWLISDRTSSPPPQVAGEAESGLLTSLAVLPFADMSAAADQGYFADGLSEEILNLLARGGALQVTARTSSFAFRDRDMPVPEIGRALGVAHLLEGSVRKSGDRLRISAQLVEVESGFQLWSESFDRPVQDIFAIQEEIAGAIARALEFTLAGEAAVTENIEAYELFLHARQLLSTRLADDLSTAGELLEQALALEPDYAPALAASAELWLLTSAGFGTYGDVPVAQARTEAEALLERALLLDPELADAHATAGLLGLQRGEFAASRASLERALAINPSHVNANHWFANLLATQGLLMEAIAGARRLREIDPLFIANRLNLAMNLANARKLDAAQAEVRSLKQSFPDDARSYTAQVYLLLATGRLAEAREELERGLRVTGSGIALRFWGDLVHASLGGYEYWEDQSTGPAMIWAMVARGEVESGLARGWQQLALTPNNNPTIVAMLEVLSVTGRYQQLLEWLAERWGGAHGLYEQVGNVGLNRYLLPVAAAQRAVGREEEFQQTLDLIGKRVDHYLRNGHDNPWIHFLEISYLAMRGESGQAIERLTYAIDGGLRDPRLAQWPAFDGLRSDPDFQREFARMTELINVERAKLGWEPLP